ncbi:Sec-independent protein translocase protein TatB [Oricola indica]|jgi:sec-independent protein translocase protein TatB|uniref:Sec-independent protein translocase protein TatB n=1 Tax=Oricola indica TaxID=2872591 RepID=UPI001CBACB5B|nr:Sec-independent protein translocase protein TatB [Oricola indica]
MLPDFGWTELLVIAIVLIVIVGPKDLPKMLRTFGRTTSSLRKMAGDFRRQFDDALKEAELDDVRNIANDLKSLDPRGKIKDTLKPLGKVGEDISSELKKATSEAEQSVKPKTAASSDSTAAAKTTEPAKTEPAKTEPAKTAPAKKPAATGKAKAATSKPAAAKTATKSRASSTASSTKKAGAAKTASTKTVSTKTASAKPATGKATTASKAGTSKAKSPAAKSATSTRTTKPKTASKAGKTAGKDQP